MRLRIVAVGTKMPGWVQTAVDEYTRRLPADWRVEWHEVRAQARAASGNAATWMQREAERIESALPSGARLVVLDERGNDEDTRGFAARVREWRSEHRPVAVVIGGADGLHDSIKRAADETVRLSSLTLPHALVRVVFAEQLYRAWSILEGHPYHRDGGSGIR